jgi:hypothetical protein
MDLHGFFQAFSVQIQEIRVNRVQNHGKSQRAILFTAKAAKSAKILELQVNRPRDENLGRLVFAGDARGRFS